MAITIITSAAYVEEELAAEFGRLPAAFLPVGHQRLYDLQIAALGAGIHLTVPESYDIPKADLPRLEAAQVTIVRVPDGLKLGQSILYALEMIGDTSQAVRIMHGDTMIYDLPLDAVDVVAIGEQPEAYEWGLVESSKPVLAGHEDPSDVLAGYFAFSDGIALRRALAQTQGNFVEAINSYGRAIGIATHKVTAWLDFGHLQTYYRSRCSIRTQRAFNSLDISFRMVEKRSLDSHKLAAESAWYEGLPPRLRMYTPGFLGSGQDADGTHHYAIEYLPVPSLHELFVFGDVGRGPWRRILESCFSFMGDCLAEGQAARHAPTPVIQRLTTEKTLGRLERFAADQGLSPDQTWKYDGKPLPSLSRIAELTAGAIDTATPDHLGIMHGDLCFTNIFYDFRTQRIRVIDPRGSLDGVTPTVFGDVRYDLAKLAHSIIGAYDFILAGRYTCEGFGDRDLRLDFPSAPSLTVLEGMAGDFRLGTLSLNDPHILAITIHLFLSMLPLHADHPQRQQAFVANALRLFAKGPFNA